MTRRVAVTGLGTVSPLGNNVRETWNNLIAGRSGIGTITRFDATPYSIRIAGEVKDFQPEKIINGKEIRHMSLATQYALHAVSEAVQDAGLEVTDENRERIGVVFGSAVGGIDSLLEQQTVLDSRGPRRVSPFFLPNMLVDSPSGHIAIRYGVQGPNFAVVSACATGGNTIGEAFEIIRRGDADVMIAGGTDAVLQPVILSGFISMRALASNNEQPEAACCPFDARRDGFILAEGAAVLILEDWDHARQRGANIYAEMIGYGAGNDAYHMATPADRGSGAARVMKAALDKARLDPTEVGYINAHGSSTPLNDKLETEAIKTIFGDHAYRLQVSSTKSMLGHMMGAAGAVEAIACVQALKNQILPPTINYQVPDPDCDLDYVPNEARQVDFEVAMSNSIGLGGHNSCVVFRKVS